MMMETCLKKLEGKLNLNLQNVAITPPESLDDCFPKLYIQQIYPIEWMQILIDAYREDMKEMVKWFLRENLCDECKKKIFGEKDVKV